MQQVRESASLGNGFLKNVPAFREQLGVFFRRRGTAQQFERDL